MTIPSFPQFFHLFVIISAGNAADTLADARYGWEGELQKNIFPHQPEPMGETKEIMHYGRKPPGKRVQMISNQGSARRGQKSLNTALHRWHPVKR